MKGAPVRELRNVSDEGIGLALRDLIAAEASLSLGTVDERGRAHVSYVPYACLGGAFVFVVSALAAHARHLAARESASGLIVGAASGDPYARPRLVTMGPARALRAGTQAADRVWAALERRHGATVAVLRTLTDFAAYVHEPEHGRLVLGFASAYDLTSATLAAATRAAESP